MTKVCINARLEANAKPSDGSDAVAVVDLSYSPNLTAFSSKSAKNRIHLRQFATGETLVRCFPKPDIDPLKISESKPPVNEGERVQKGLSRRGRTKIRRAAQLYQQMVEGKRTEKAYATFITLTYGKVWADDKTAKRDLDAFMKRMRRKFGQFHYVWVAERQKRGAIHFHILTPNYVDKKWLNKAWNGVVNGRWEKENPKAVQKLYPNVGGVFHAGAYMAKYISKEGENIVGNGWFVSHMTNEALQPTFEQCYDVDQEKTEEVFEFIRLIGEEGGFQNEYVTDERTRLKWFSAVKGTLFEELKTHVLNPELSSIPIDT